MKNKLLLLLVSMLPIGLHAVNSNQKVSDVHRDSTFEVNQKLVFKRGVKKYLITAGKFEAIERTLKPSEIETSCIATVKDSAGNSFHNDVKISPRQVLKVYKASHERYKLFQNLPTAKLEIRSDKQNRLILNCIHGYSGNNIPSVSELSEDILKDLATLTPITKEEEF